MTFQAKKSETWEKQTCLFPTKAVTFLYFKADSPTGLNHINPKTGSAK